MKFRYEIAGKLTFILVPYRQRNIIDIEREGVAEKNEHEHGNDDGHAETSPVAEDLDEFLFGDGLYSLSDSLLPPCRIVGFDKRDKDVLQSRLDLC